VVATQTILVGGMLDTFTKLLYANRHRRKSDYGRRTLDFNHRLI